MKKSLLENIISFLLGFFWALLIISALIIFKSFINLGFFPAFLLTFISTVFWLFFIVLLEMANIQIERLKELKKQTKILENIRKKVDG